MNPDRVDAAVQPSPNDLGPRERPSIVLRNTNRCPSSTWGRVLARSSNVSVGGCWSRVNPGPLSTIGMGGEVHVMSLKKVESGPPQCTAMPVGMCQVWGSKSAY